MDLKTKKDIVINYFSDTNFLDLFNVIEEEEAIILRSDQNIGNSSCLITVILEEGLYNPIYYSICNLMDTYKKDKIVYLLNKFNEENKLIRFYLDDEDYIIGEVTYISNNDFDPELFQFLLINSFNVIKDNYYAKIMKTIWA